MSTEQVVVMVSHPEEAGAREMARDAVARGLAACVQRMQVSSTFTWEQKLCDGEEWLLVMKTAAARVAALQDFILRHHPYDVPEFLVLPVTGGAPEYLQWMLAATGTKEVAP